MKTVKSTLDEAPSRGMTPWMLLLRDELGRLDGEPLLRTGFGRVSYEVRHAGASLWIVTT